MSKKDEKPKVDPKKDEKPKVSLVTLIKVVEKKGMKPVEHKINVSKEKAEELLKFDKRFKKA